MYARRLGEGVKTFNTFSMGKIEYANSELVIAGLSDIEDLMFQMVIVSGHYVSGDESVVLYVEQ